MGLDAAIMLAITAAGGYTIDGRALSGSRIATIALFWSTSLRSTASVLAFGVMLLALIVFNRTHPRQSSDGHLAAVTVLVDANP